MVVSESAAIQHKESSLPPLNKYEEIKTPHYEQVGGCVLPSGLGESYTDSQCM